MRDTNVLRGPRQKCIAILLGAASIAPAGLGQQLSIDPERPTGTVFLRPYKAPTIPPIRVRNSSRVQDLIRSGKLYLTAQDAIALALENNIDIESARYQPLIDQWQLELYQAGGSLPGVPAGSSQVSSVTSGQGVSGSQQSAGVSGGNNNSSGSNAVNATIAQIGPTTPALDPVFQQQASFSHLSSPQANSVQSQTVNYIENLRRYTSSLTEGFITGGQVSLTYNDSYDRENAASDVLNPSSATLLSLSLSQNLLQGFGIAVNSRFITVAKANLKLDDLIFKGEVIGVVVNVLNLYYGLVADYEDAKAKQTAVEVAQQFYQNNKKQVEIGTMAPLDVTTAEAQVASSQQDLVISQTTLEQEAVLLKNVLSRNGLGDPLIREVQIIPLDRIDVPEQDTLPPLKSMIASALANRTDIAGNKLSFTNAQVSALGTANGVLPQLAALAGASNRGLSGVAQPVPQGSLTTTGQGTANGTGGPVSIPQGFGPCPAPNAGQVCEFPNPYVVGNIGTALGQTIRRDFPTERVGGYLAPTLRNRIAQSDYAIDQLTLRQTELQNQRSTNQIAVDVSNQVVGLQQARVRYQAAVKNRILEQQLLEAEQKRFSLGASTTFLVVQQQRDLATAQSSETAALVAYSNSRVTLDQTLGATLDTNHITVTEAQKGRVNYQSVLPASLPTQP